MLFVPAGSPSPRHGRLLPSEPGGMVVEDDDGRTYGPEQVALVVPDDEAMAVAATRAGFKVHTPMSANLGLGATGLD